MAGVLGVSHTTVRRMEESGQLHPAIGTNGKRLFDVAEVGEAKRLRPATASGTTAVNEAPIGGTTAVGTTGETAARVFARLNKGEELTTIVVEEKLDPAIVKRYAQQWLELKEVDLNSPSVPRVLAELAESHRQLNEEVKMLIVGYNGLVSTVYGVPP